MKVNKSLIRRFTIVSLILISIFIVGLGIVVVQPNKIEVINNSTAVLTKVEIIVGFKNYGVSNLDIGEKTSFWYLFNSGDSYFEVFVTNGRGDKFDSIGGYMTSGFVFQTAKITILPKKEILIEQL